MAKLPSIQMSIMVVSPILASRDLQS